MTPLRGLAAHSHDEPQLLVGAKSILWVTAHRTLLAAASLNKTNMALPDAADDESFFFAPTILNLLGERPVDGHLLCLSIGSFGDWPSSL